MNSNNNNDDNSSPKNSNKKAKAKNKSSNNETIKEKVNPNDELPLMSKVLDLKSTSTQHKPPLTDERLGLGSVITRSTLNTIEIENNDNKKPVVAAENSKGLPKHHLNATRQLGGKGTIRRRRIRKSLSTPDPSNNEAFRHFLSKFDFDDYGNMERVTLINDNGLITSYDSIHLYSNWKNGLFYLNLSKYHPKPHLTHNSSSRSKINEKDLTSSIENLEKKKPIPGNFFFY